MLWHADDECVGMPERVMSKGEKDRDKSGSIRGRTVVNGANLSYGLVGLLTEVLAWSDISVSKCTGSVSWCLYSICSTAGHAWAQYVII
jgi:hypothetical protein